MYLNAIQENKLENNDNILINKTLINQKTKAFLHPYWQLHWFMKEKKTIGIHSSVKLMDDKLRVQER